MNKITRYDLFTYGILGLICSTFAFIYPIYLEYGVWQQGYYVDIDHYLIAFTYMIIFTTMGFLIGASSNEDDHTQGKGDMV